MTPPVWSPSAARVAEARLTRFIAALDEPGVPGARWFPGATLNFAENLMGAADERPALVFRAESGERRELSRAELHREVTRLAAGLRAADVGGRGSWNNPNHYK